MQIRITLPCLTATILSEWILILSSFLLLTEFFARGSSVPNQPAGVFWAVVASLLIICQTIILGRQFLLLFVYFLTAAYKNLCSLVSEVGWPMAFFDRYFPVLGSEFGLGALGIFQCLSVPSYPLLSNNAETNSFLGSQLKFYLTTLMTLPSSPPSSFLLLGASTCSSVSFSVSQPKLSVPSPLGAPRSKVFSHLPKTTARFSSTIATLFLEPFHLLARSRITSCAKTRLLLTIDHGGAPKRLDMDLEDKEKNQLLFVDLCYRNLLNRCRGI